MNQEESISFLLPGSGKSPSGGLKVIYEQANRLVNAGYTVYMVYPVQVFIRKITFRNILGTIKRYLQGFLFDSYKAKWFDLDPKIKEVKAFSLRYSKVPKTKFYCATSLETSYFLNDYPINTKNKIYYIQGYETGNTPEPYTSRSYTFDMKKIAIAPYLMEKVKATGNEAYYIPNGFDFVKFGVDSAIEKRNPHIAMMMYASNDDIKRCSDSIKAFEIVKEKIHDLKVLMFGVPARPNNLPEWFEYHQTPGGPELRELYNTAAIFVASSRTEGLALPPAEAFICGCALCCTDIGGFAVYAKPDVTAKVCKVYDYKTMAENILFLMTHNNVRIEYAKAGNKLMQEYTWERASEAFLKVLEG